MGLVVLVVPSKRQARRFQRVRRWCLWSLCPFNACCCSRLSSQVTSFRLQAEPQITGLDETLFGTVHLLQRGPGGRLYREAGPRRHITHCRDKLTSRGRCWHLYLRRTWNSGASLARSQPQGLLCFRCRVLHWTSSIFQRCTLTKTLCHAAQDGCFAGLRTWTED